jgi:hypothetical protein
MGKRKKRESRRSTQADTAKTSGEARTSTRLKPANPPKRNPMVLAISLLLFAGWFAFLIYVAATTNP